MINEENFRGFIAALRSDEYRQGKDRLSNVYADGSKDFCCLGVACEYALAHGLPGRSELLARLDGHFAARYRFNYHMSTTTLPMPVARFFGFVDDNPWLKLPCGCAARASALNDKAGWDLHQIADAFEHTFLDAGYPEGTVAPRHSGGCRDSRKLVEDDLTQADVI